MKINNISSNPNDTVAIIVKVSKLDDDRYHVLPGAVAFGRIDEQTGEFICKDNGSVFRSVETYSGERDSEVIFYCFAKKEDELKAKYGNDLTSNGLMIYYLRDVQNSITYASRSIDGLSLHFIPEDDIASRSSDPIYEMSNTKSSSSISIPTIITAPAMDAKALPSAGRLVDPTKELIDLEDFIRFMSERIVKNDVTMERLCTTIAMNFLATTPDQVHRILSIGPTGSGKSQTFKTMGEYLDHPIVICDCNELSAAGYVGKGVDDFLMDILTAAKGNIDKANRAIFVLDEIDKLKQSGLEMKEAAQNSLLKVVEGQVYTIETDKKWGTKAALDTAWMTVVGCGAFSEIFEKRQSGGFKKPIGFVTGPFEEKTAVKEEDMLAEILDDELKEYGFKKEFIPRFQKRYTYRPLDEEGLRFALTNSKNSSLLHTIRTYLETFNCDVIYDDSFIEAIVQEAVALDQGGRSLTKTVARAFSDADTAIYIQHFKDQKQGVVKKRTLKLTGETLRDPKKFDLK